MGWLYVKVSPWYYVVPMHGTALCEDVTLIGIMWFLCMGRHYVQVSGPWVLRSSYAWDGFYVKVSPWHYVVPMHGTALCEDVTLIGIMWFLCMGRLYVKMSWPWYYVVPMHGDGFT